jgi:arginyl-tRNA synthetase
LPLLLCPPHHHQSGDPIDEAELEAAANALGYGAVKYADLKNSRLTNYKFSFDAMLELKGNTAVYLLYAHARIAGIVRKSGKDVDALVAGGTQFKLEHARERELAMAIVQVGGQDWALRQGVESSAAWSCECCKPARQLQCTNVVV